MENINPIDAVITWVDGEDTKHIAKRNKILGREVTQNSKASAAFVSVNEIAYCVKSIIEYAPFIRTIFIVTDDQIPDIYYEYPDRIKIIDHQEIYRDYLQLLPTINIFSIECLLYRIPNLAENFIYFNDDFFLIKPTAPNDWFVKDCPVLRGRWETPPEKIWYKRIAGFLGIRSTDRAGFRKTQSTSAQLLGFEDKYFRCYHTPRALRKSTFENYFTQHPELLFNQIKYNRRHVSQFNPYSLAWHLEIKNDTAVISPYVGIIELHHLDRKSVTQLNRILKNTKNDKHTLFANIQNLSLADKEAQQIIFDWLTRIITGNGNAKPIN